MDKTVIADVRSIITKIEKQQELSGTYSFQLLSVEGGKELYESVQKSEFDARTARETTDIALNAYLKQKAVLDGIDKQLTTLTRIGAESCSAFGVEIANDVLKADSGDVQAAAMHIAHYLARVPLFGAGLAQAINDQRCAHVDAENTLNEVSSGLEAATRELKSAFYNAVSIVAQAKAFLSVKGISVRDRKPSSRKSKKHLTVVPSPTPTSAADSTKAPAPGPVPVITFAPRPVPAPAPEVG